MEWLKELFAPYIPYLIPLGIFGLFLVASSYILLRAYIIHVINKEDDKTKELLNSLIKNTNPEH